MSMRRVLGGLFIALFMAGCSSSGSTPSSQTSIARSAPLPSGLAAATSSNILGLWKPTGPHGQTSLPFVLFSSGRWSGSDGCNAFNGQYSLGEGGELDATSGPSTLIGCDNWQGPSWVAQASRVAIDGTKLLLFDQAGKRLGVMVKSVPKRN